MDIPIHVIPSAGVFVFYGLTLFFQVVGFGVLIWQIWRLSRTLSHVADISEMVKVNQSILMQIYQKSR